jgi:Glyoxalase/Bleomycin resistance protein/Dioxygenase superfamily
VGSLAPPLVEITVGDEPAAWASLGFAVGDGGACPVGTVTLRLAGPAGARGITGWALADGGGDIDGLATAAADLGSQPADPVAHANGVLSIDHLVVATPDLERTTAALEDRGIAARRTREAGRGRAQRFFRLGEVILELVGPTRPAGDGPASFWGLAFTVADLDATAARLDGRIGPPKDAVQPGRRIATLHAGDEISVPVAFMSQAHR